MYYNLYKWLLYYTLFNLAQTHLNTNLFNQL